MAEFSVFLLTVFNKAMHYLFFLLCSFLLLTVASSVLVKWFCLGLRLGFEFSSLGLKLLVLFTSLQESQSTQCGDMAKTET